MQHGDLKFFIMTHQHTEARNQFPSKTRNPHGTLKTHVTPLHACGTLGFHRTPVEEYRAR